MKKYLLIFIMLIGIVSMGFAHPGGPRGQRKFDPKRFEIEMRQYISSKAGLTPKEAADFFPVFDEMQQKQRMLFDKMRQYRFVNTNDNNASLEAIKGMDEIDLQIKELQRQYHLKFCQVLPAGKVLQVIKADEEFHRLCFKRMVKRNARK